MRMRVDIVMKWCTCWRVVLSVQRAAASRFRRSLSGRTGMDLICERIKATGPLTVAEYTKECLLNPLTGYYMQKDVFGSRGDFTTSPEISQVFGELLAVWVLADRMSRLGRQRCEEERWRLVELGPGRGTLAMDVLRVLGRFKAISALFSLHLVEASPALAKLQERTLTGLTSDSGTTKNSCDGGRAFEYTHSARVQGAGADIFWHRHLSEVPKDYPSYFIAQEFFDALPVHQFQKTANGWREVLVDVDPSGSSLRFVLAPGHTPASVSYAPFLPTSSSDEEHQGQGDKEGEGKGEGNRVRYAEVSAEGLALASELASRVKEQGGAAIIADYGEEQVTKGNTLRGFKNHKLFDVLKAPGSCDMTADVNFGILKKVIAATGAGCFGPMTQNEFLHRMGIRHRIDALLQSASPEQAKDLLSSYQMLTSPEEMGKRFKFMAITSSPTHIPTPFNAQ